MNNYENFDAKVDLFLKKQLSREEELSFLSELNHDEELLKRAKVIALAVQTLKEIKKNKANLIIKEISKISNDEFHSAIWSDDITTHFDELADRFLKKQLSEEEEQQFLDKLNEIPVLQDRAKAIALATQEIQRMKNDKDREIIDKIAKMNENEYRSSAKLPRKSKYFKPRLLHYAAAASIIFVVGFSGYKYYQYDQTVKLGVEYYQPLETTFRGSDDTAENEVREVFKHIENDDNIKSAISQLTLFYNDIKNNEYSNYSDYKVDITWNLAIAYLKDNNRKQALAILKQIALDNKGKAIADKAKELIDKLEKI